MKRVKNTIAAMEKLRQDFEAAKPDTVLVVSPHAPINNPYAFGINSSQELTGDFLNFGLAQSFKFASNQELARNIKEAGVAQNIRTHFFQSPLDHGALVPLRLLRPDRNVGARDDTIKLVHLSFCFLPLVAHYLYGEILGKACEQSKARVALIASGDLSHRLTPEAPAGYSPQGKKFDAELVDLLKQGDAQAILNLDEEFIQEAGECGLRSFVILLGALRNAHYQFKILSYEGPFGVGYLVAEVCFLNPPS